MKVILEMIKMKFHRRKWFNFDIICMISICLLLVSSVQPFPRPKEKSLKIASQTNKNSDSAVETLNSKKINVNKKKCIEEPVFDDNNSDNYRSARYLKIEMAPTDQSNGKDSTHQLNVPFMAVPSNWVATFEPSNAVIITNKVPLRFWAIGSVAKFPSFLEKIVQRIQSYYSTYKYHDLSRPATQAIISPQYHLHDIENIGSNESTDSFDNLDSMESIESIESDPIEDDTTETYTETPIPDYYETTTDFLYMDQDENGTTESNNSFELST